MPKPNPNESEADFVSRYMSSTEAKKKFPDDKQRLAVAYSEYRKKHKSSDSEMVYIKAPITKFWEEEVEINKSAKNVEKSKQRFIEVVVSGLKEDRDGERMSQLAVDDMIMQFKSGSIGFFPDHGFHEMTGKDHVYSWKQMMGAWVDARQEGDNLIAVVRLNKAHPDQEMFWNFINEGMPIGFSIGGRPLEDPTFIEEEVEDIPTLKEVEKK
jgi:hypothetical protein